MKQLRLTLWGILGTLLLTAIPTHAQSVGGSCQLTLLTQKVAKASTRSKALGGRFTNDDVTRIVEKFAAHLASKKTLPQPASYAEFLPKEVDPANLPRTGFAEEALELALKTYPALLDELKLHFAKILADKMTSELLPVETADLSKAFGLDTRSFEKLFGTAQDILAWIDAGADGSEKAQKVNKTLEAARDKIMGIYAGLLRELGKMPTAEDLFHKLLSSSQTLRASGTELETFLRAVGEGSTKGAALFDGLEDLYHSTLKNPLYADSFRGVILAKYDHEHNTRIAELLLKHPRMILTAAAPGVPLHDEAFDALRKFAREKDAPIVVMAEANQPFYLDERLVDKENEGIYILTQSVYLSPWLRINDLPLTFKRADPLSPLRGAGMGGPRGQTQIVFHAQQRDDILPTVDNHLLPHRLVSTGAITQDFYRGRHVISGVTDQLARERHDIGFVLVEKEASRSSKGAEASGLFHIRHVGFSDSHQGFVDLGRVFTSNSSKKARPEAVVAGDLHLGKENQKLIGKLFDFIREHRPKRLVLHDIFDGRSVNHHESARPLTRAQKAMRGELDLVEELNAVTEFINSVHAVDSSVEVVIVPSNHNDWLTKWLNDHVRNMSSPYYALAIELQNQMTNHAGKAPFYGDPLAYYVLGRPDEILKDKDRQHLWDKVVKVTNPRKVTFLQRGESYRVGRTELSLHGDMGPNGSRGSTRSLARTMDFGVIGHTHSPGRLGGIVNVGTLTELPMDYTTGSPSSSANAFAVVYEGDVIQLHHFNPVSGDFANETASTVPNNQVFPKGYPFAAERPAEESGVDSADQWRDFRGLKRRQ